MKLIPKLKSLSLLMVFGLLINCLPVNATPGDSTKVDTAKFNILKTRVDTIKRKLDTTNLNIKAILDTLKKPASDKPTCPCRDDKELGGGWILVFLPALLFLVLLLVLGSKGLSEFSLKEALSENAYPSVILQNPKYDPASLTNADLLKREDLSEIIPPTIEVTYGTEIGDTITTTPAIKPNPSVSRYIAFLTSILTLVIVLGVVCFYIYHYIRTGCPPELTGISTLLIALGIGVLPYVFNKMAGAISKSKDDSI